MIPDQSSWGSSETQIRWIRISTQKKEDRSLPLLRIWMWSYLNSDLTTWLTILATSLGISCSLASYTTLENE